MSHDKKTALNESVVRRFMKLAEIGTLSDSFVREAFEDEEEDLGEELPEEPAPEMGEEPAPEMGMEPEAAAGGAKVELDVEALVARIAGAIEDETQAQGSPVSLDVQGGGEDLGAALPPEPEPGMEAPPEEMGELPPEEEEEELAPGMRYEGNLKKGEAGLANQGPNKDNSATAADPGPHKLKAASGKPAGSLAENEEEELEEADIDLVDDDALVAEVARKVAERLVKEARKNRR